MNKKKNYFLVTSAYSRGKDCGYIGNVKMAQILNKKGIEPELAHPWHRVCSIGYCKKRRKWYGWSHRAIFGFGIGYVVKKGDCCATPGWTEEYLKNHPEKNKSLPVGFKAKNLEDCKRLAIAFAESVS